MSFDVHVVDDRDRPVTGSRVVLAFTALLRSMTTTEYTDEDGHAEFDGYDDGEVVVYVDGANCGTYQYEDGSGITICV